tara:strand:- start:9 stop:491 length:483 start_codon:yes stop_codon:yes gene_type:complete
MPQLTVNEAGNSTFTDSITIKSGDFAAAVIGTKADDATHTINYDIPQGAVVQKVAYKLNEAFDDSGSGISLTLTVGDDDTAAGYIGASQLHLDGTEVTYAYNDGSYFTAGGDANTVNGKLYTASGKEFKLLFTPDATGTAYSLNELTQGNITVFIEMARL